MLDFEPQTAAPLASDPPPPPRAGPEIACRRRAGSRPRRRRPWKSRKSHRKQTKTLKNHGTIAANHANARGKSDEKHVKHSCFRASHLGVRPSRERPIAKRYGISIAAPAIQIDIIENISYYKLFWAMIWLLCGYFAMDFYGFSRPLWLLLP